MMMRAVLIALALACGGALAAPSLTVNGTVAGGSLVVRAGSALQVVVTDDPGNELDWIGLYAVGGSGYLDWRNRQGTTAWPPSGPRVSSFTIPAPASGGTFELRYNGPNMSVLARSATITVIVPWVTVNGMPPTGAVTVTAGASLRARFADGPGGTLDWIGLYAVGQQALIDWRSPTGDQTWPSAGARAGEFAMTAPASGGPYELRYFGGAGATLLSRSAPIALGTPPPPVLVVNGVPPNGSLSITGMAMLDISIAYDPGGAAAWIGLFPVGEPSLLDWRSMSGDYVWPSASPRLDRITMRGPHHGGPYELRFYDNEQRVVARSAPITVIPPELTVNGVGAAGTLQVVPGTPLVVTVTHDPGDEMDWVGLYRDGETMYTDWRNLSGNTAWPPVGPRVSSFMLRAPGAGGAYQLRFIGHGMTVLTRSATITNVAPAPPVLTVNGTAAPDPVVVDPGTTLDVNVASDPGGEEDWIGLHKVGEAGYVDWRSMRGNTAWPPSGPRVSGFGIPAPGAQGTYELRYHSFGSVIAKSTQVRVNGPHVTAQLTAPTAGQTLTSTSVDVKWSGGRGATGYWVQVYDGTGKMLTGTNAWIGTTSWLARNLPGDGRALVIRFWTRFTHDGDYEEATPVSFRAGLAVRAEFTEPGAGSTLPGPSVTFKWTAGSLVDEYYLDVGTEQRPTMFFSGAVKGLSQVVDQLPDWGVTVRASLYSRIGGALQTPRTITLTMGGSAAANTTRGIATQVVAWSPSKKVDEIIALARAEGATVPAPDFADIQLRKAGVVVLEPPAGTARDAFIASLGAKLPDGWVSAVSGHDLAGMQAAQDDRPDDRAFDIQYQHHALKTEPAWLRGKGGPAIGIVDSGVDVNHPDLAEYRRDYKVHPIYRWNAVDGSSEIADLDNNHGTTAATLAAGWRDNTAAGVGVAWLSTIVPVKVVFDDAPELGYRATSKTIAAGIVWAADHGCRVISVGFGGLPGNRIVDAAAAYARRSGALVVAPAGNHSGPDVASGRLPFERSDNVLFVSGLQSMTSTQDRSTASLSTISRTGPFVDLAAPCDGLWFGSSEGVASQDQTPARPYVADASTVLLDHFENTVQGSVLAFEENGSTPKPPATPRYEFVDGPPGLGKALLLRPPEGVPPGSATYVKYPGKSLPPVGTIEFWVKKAARFRQNMIIHPVEIGAGPDGHSLVFHVNEEGVPCAYNPWAYLAEMGGGFVQPDRWTHVALTWSPGSSKMFCDGIERASNPRGDWVKSMGSDLFAFRSPTGDPGLAIDELCISNTAFTSFHVPRFTPPPNAIPRSMVAASDVGGAYRSGTSYSAALVAGVAALVLSVNQNFSADDVRAILEETATELGAAGRDEMYGAGLVDADRATELALTRQPSLRAAGNLAGLRLMRIQAAGLRGISPATADTEGVTPEGQAELAKIGVQLVHSGDVGDIGANPTLETGYPVYQYPAAKVPGGFEFRRQLHHALLGSSRSWDFTTGSANITIAVLDTGVDPDHPDLKANLVPGFNYCRGNSDTRDDVGHGTAVAGLIGANGGQTGAYGMVWRCKLMPIKISEGLGTNSSWVAAGINGAVERGANIINISYENLLGDAAIEEAARRARERGVLVFAASGNSGAKTMLTTGSAIVAVGAVNEFDERVYFSNYGPGLSLMAYGDRIRTTLRGGGHGHMTGTSFSSPIAAGAAALVWSANEDLRADDVLGLLTSTARDLGAPDRDDLFGYGRIRPALAVAGAVGRSNPIQDNQWVYGGPGYQRATGVAVHNGRIFVSAVADEKGKVGTNEKEAMALSLPVNFNEATPVSWAFKWPQMPWWDDFNAVTAIGDSAYFGGQTAAFSGDSETKPALVKVPAAGPGVPTWSRVQNMFSYDGAEGASAVCSSIENGTPFVYVAGGGQYSHGYGSTFVLKYDTAGNRVATGMSPNPTWMSGEHGYGIAVQSGAVHVAGLTHRPSEGDIAIHPCIWQFSPSLSFVRRIKDSTRHGQFSAIATTADAIYVVGHQFDRGVDGSEDFLIARYSLDGTLVSSRRYGGSQIDKLTGVTVIGNQVWVVGHTQSEGGGLSDIVVMRIDPVTLDQLSITYVGGPATDRATGCATDGTSLFVVGETSSIETKQGNLFGDSDIIVLRYTIPQN